MPGLDDAELGSGAAHVEAERPLAVQASGDLRGEQCPAGGAALDQPDREAHGLCERSQTAARGHQEQPAAQAQRFEARIEVGQVAAHERSDVCVGARGREAFVLADLRAHLRRQRDGRLGPALGQDLGGALLVPRVEVRVQVTHRRGSHPVVGKLGSCGTHGVLVERQQHASVSAQPLRYADATVPRDERLRPPHVEVVLLEPVLVGHLDRVADAVRGEQRRAGTAALDQGVGGQRCAVDEHLHLRGLDARSGQDVPDALEHAIGWRVLGGQHLRRVEVAGPAVTAHFERDVGERAADVGCEPGARACHPPSVGAPSWVAPCDQGGTVQAWRAATNGPADRRRGPVRGFASASCERPGIPRSWTVWQRGSNGASTSLVQFTRPR